MPVRKPDPEHLLETVRRCGGQPGGSVMVGDSQTDSKTAAAAQVPMVLVSFGYSDVALKELQAAHVIDHYDALDAALIDLLA